MDAMLRDLRLGLRTLRKSPALTAVSVLALALGIGLTTMMFSIVYGVLLRGLPYEQGDRIAMVYRSNLERDIERQSLPIQDFADVREAQRSFSALGGFTGGTMNVSGTDRAERYSGSWVTAGVLEIPGVAPALGRTFRAGEDVPGGPRVAVLGYAIWRDRFGNDPGVLGRTIRVNGEPYEVVGVMPEGYRFPEDGALWLPLQADPLLGVRGEGAFVDVVGMLTPGATMESATAELATLASRLADEHAASNAGFAMFAMPFIEGQIGDEASGLLFTMLGAVFFVLLIACANVANLLLDRAAHRSREVGVRAALGATRAEIVRIFLAESSVLALAGTVVGVVLAKVGVDAFNRAIADTEPPFFIDIDLYPPVLLFAIGVSVVATLFAGLIPAFQASRPDIAEVLKDESRGASSLRIGKLSRALVVFEVALSCTLLVAAGLMVKSVTRASTRDTGFTTADVFTARFGFPVTYTDTVAQQQLQQQLVERVAALPGVTAATVASGLPAAPSGFGGDDVMIEGTAYARAQDVPEVRTANVGAHFFETLAIGLRSGRVIEAGDRTGTLPVAVVNERFVRQHFGAQSPIGRRIRLGGFESSQPWLTVVGVVDDVFAGSPQDPRPAVVYRALAQAPASFVYVAARTDGDPMALMAPVREALASLDPDLPIYWPLTLERAILNSQWPVRVFGTMFALFGVIALFLASIGLYAVMSLSVVRRTREVGIRLALGASPPRVVRLLFTQAAWQLGVGLVIGLALAAGASRLLSELLFDVDPLDGAVFAAVAGTLALVGLGASFIPARRAAGVDPAEAMRVD